MATYPRRWFLSIIDLHLDVFEYLQLLSVLELLVYIARLRKLVSHPIKGHYNPCQPLSTT